eukprot:TRINITY_DN16115_c0_g1_i1.p1 TRINITY_DN16115_c0_g1~~TRINITY_DN16115_c0_g1_i1.p1  ORF type:complete len:529 (+),score=156.67 TRINITY_DN16115_c0_g1_i1:176-1588(+)
MGHHILKSGAPIGDVITILRNLRIEELRKVVYEKDFLIKKLEVELNSLEADGIIQSESKPGALKIYLKLNPKKESLSSPNPPSQEELLQKQQIQEQIQKQQEFQMQRQQEIQRQQEFIMRQQHLQEIQKQQQELQQIQQLQFQELQKQQQELQLHQHLQQQQELQKQQELQHQQQIQENQKQETKKTAKPSTPLSTQKGAQKQQSVHTSPKKKLTRPSKAGSPSSSPAPSPSSPSTPSGRPSRASKRTPKGYKSEEEEDWDDEQEYEEEEDEVKPRNQRGKLQRSRSGKEEEGKTGRGKGKSEIDMEARGRKKSVTRRNKEDDEFLIDKAPSRVKGKEVKGRKRKHEEIAYDRKLMDTWQSIVLHRYAEPFRYPVTEEDAPGYDEVITNRMDLETVKRNIENGEISSPEGLWEALSLMFQNARDYNGKDSDLWKMADTLEQYTRNRMSQNFTSFIPQDLQSRNRSLRRKR